MLIAKSREFLFHSSPTLTMIKGVGKYLDEVGRAN